ncbi:MAG: acylphosphatase [Acidobacteriota bacterium]|nr:acylphosphatase [Acidobacteriota bacterium]
MKPKTARRFVISGRVQGVGFRAFAQLAARELAVTGWAQNLENGDVEVHANGAPQRLDAFEARLRQGPRWSEVRSVTIGEVEASDASGFYIR